MNWKVVKWYDYNAYIILEVVMLTSIFGAQIKKTKEVNFVLKKVLFILLKVWLHKFASIC